MNAEQTLKMFCS